LRGFKLKWAKCPRHVPYVHSECIRSALQVHPICTRCAFRTHPNCTRYAFCSRSYRIDVVLHPLFLTRKVLCPVNCYPRISVVGSRQAFIPRTFQITTFRCPALESKDFSTPHLRNLPATQVVTNQNCAVLAGGLQFFPPHLVMPAPCEIRMKPSLRAFFSSQKKLQ